MPKSSKEVFGRFTSVDSSIDAGSLHDMARGTARSYRIFNANSDEHLVTVTLPIEMSEEETADFLTGYKRNFADQIQLGAGVELAHIAIDRDEAVDLGRTIGYEI